MSIPVLKLGPVLIASFPSEVTDAALAGLEGELAEKVGQFHSRGVILDLTRLSLLDSYATRILSSIGQVSRLRGARTIVVGIQPEVAFAMVQLGLSLGITTAVDVDDAIALLGDESDADATA